MENKVSKMQDEEIKKEVRKAYGVTASGRSACCSGADACCGSGVKANDIGRCIGYTESDMEGVPPGANLGLGCGNPIALASLQSGETVLDLGSGAGFDCFLAAKRVGEAGKVIGVDMTTEMVEKARENASNGGYANVEFRLGEIEDLPVVDGSVDVVISNCVINLVPNKKRAFSEAYRVLKPGGRLMISDLILLQELPEVIRESVQSYVGCLSGAILKDEYLRAIREAGFRDVGIIEEVPFPVELMASDVTAQAAKESLSVIGVDVKRVSSSVASIRVRAVKPANTGHKDG